MSGFVHLHCHTEYSLLDGAIKIKDLCARAVDYGLPAAAITDHGNLFGAVIFYTTARDFGLNPIIGCEVYVAQNHQEKGQERYHLVLLAENKTGYHNLIKIVTKGWLDGFYYKPRVDKEILKKYSDGLIALSACLQGEVQYKLQKEGFEAGLNSAREYAHIFPGRFYLEMQANGIREQEEVNAKLQEMAQKTGLPLVATNDCHYLTKDDVQAHDILLCIQTNSKVDEPSRMRFNTDELYFKSPEEMERAFKDCPQALENVQEIAQRCQVELDLGKHYFPVYALPEGMTLEDEFVRLAREGLKQRLKDLPYSVDEEKYWERLEQELEIICQKGFAGYFLIVQDFINWAKAQGIPVGPGRGSAAGSLVAYALKITNLDPIKYKLLFERFLNVERTSLPDIDVDFCYDRREEVIRYVTEKYGKDSVAQITTFGTMKAKAVVRDVARAMGLSLSLADKIAKLIPDELKMTIDKALEKEPDLKKMVEEDELIARLMDICRRLEGLARHASTHAAGIVISDKPMDEYLPLYRGKKGEVVTQFDMKRVEKVGLIKFDFLGLKTLTVISDTLKLARQGGKQVPDMDKLPLDDEKTFELLCAGETDGVFQLESSGMRKVLTDLKPNCFEDIIALLALYRPGPLESGMVNDFIRRKHGQIPVEYPHEALESILKETYGVILYQEQVMQIAAVLANYSLGDGDILRRAMGKKEPAVMAAQRTKFMQGARENNVPEEVAEHIFDLMEKFAGYGFNKSHSAAYALISYQTAYLKAHYPVEFMAALITSEVNNTDKVITHINACRDMNIEVLPPDINHSHYYFSVEGGKMRFGLAGIKNVGQGAIEEIVREREENGPYSSLLNFCERVNLRKVTKRVIEMLIKSGAMDCFGCSRNGLLAGMEKVVARAQQKAKHKSKGQLSFLSLVQKDSDSISGLGLDCPQNSLEEFSDEEKLKMEKEALGLYLSGHPLLPFKEEIKRLGINELQRCRELSAGTEVHVAVMVVGKKEHLNKKGEKMAFCQIEDLSASAEVTFFADVYAQYKSLLDSEEPLFLKAKISAYEGLQNTESDSEDNDRPKQIKLLGQDVQLLQDAINNDHRPINITIDIAQKGENGESGVWTGLKKIIEKYPGQVPVQLSLLGEDFECKLQLGPEYGISPNQRFWTELERLKD
jgi:DNA polymerase-3 subunit alpha